MVILDDRAARSFAEVMRVTFLGTAGVLFHAFVKKHLTLAELEDAVEALSQTIWLAPSDIYGTDVQIGGSGVDLAKRRRYRRSIFLVNRQKRGKQSFKMPGLALRG